MGLVHKEEFRVYTKYNDQKNYKAIDTDTGHQVGNLIYASLVPIKELKMGKEFCRDLVDLNEHIVSAKIVSDKGVELYRYPQEEK